MVAVNRTLAQSIAEAADPQLWLAALSARFTPAEVALLTRALQWTGQHCENASHPQTGTPLFQHAVASASIVADLRLGADAIAAALLFAVTEVLDKPIPAIAEAVSPEAAKLVDGIARLRKLQWLNNQSLRAEERNQQIEGLRKMLLAMVEDIRAVLILLAWRTQTMHVLAQAPEAVRREVAQETLEIFAPLANRLGVWQIKWELEDLGFRHLHPDTYKKIAKLLDERRVDRERFITNVLDTLRAELKTVGIKADLMGRPKHIYSIWKKMQKKKLDFSELYDIRAVRVLVDDLKDCYTVLGIVHNLWQPIPGEFDDYIAQPKGNNYRSLHTAVIGPEDKAVEVQIRTFDMHEHAEYGVAAHWRYKEGGRGDSSYEEKIAWLRQLLDWREDSASDSHFADAFKAELFDDTIYVQTPAGKVIALPRGSTPVDFAYHVHTDLGHRCRGAKVDGAIVPLNTPLENGQRIEIIAAKEGGPSLDWLHQGYVKSHRAATKLRHWIRQQNQDVAREAGKTIYDKEAARAGATHVNQEQVASRLGLKTIDEVFLSLGQGELTLRELADALTETLAPPPAPAQDTPDSIIKSARADQHGQGILIEGVDKLMTLLAKCCKPVPPDPVMGFVTRGRGISIHRADCQALKRLAAESPERLIKADWGKQQGQTFATDIEVEAHERAHLLRDLSDTMARDKINVTAVTMQPRDNRVYLRFTVEIRDTEQLQRIFAKLREISGVIRAERS
ncbi:RelA/SpoT family protein [Chitinilyticum piscinae]|uniref:GTP pyrophosphokinase n=1 Tax=Chitinilyticum piscinae TaxID=2866724 RepID=A0A8J7FMF5_9NEIS|nr:bifunctional (p)ppGpp synthetase/guanosine-3',5'-bis(diphosphate) 3'-pyrophosphohydrolase [Chitinilyticum piscinae]MBE9610677.1 bifunctional (p)ppGpp synthetase/guanosine-3',5'-bis(diphosphate) 3'-pyrophosphohydrolase [Chitinilyticum piscinae]